MAETRAIFDKGVFSFSFDVVDIVPILLRVNVKDVLQRIEAGQAVVIIIHIGDQTTTYGRTYLFNPGEFPEITLYKPDNTVLLAATDMDQIEQGIYRHRQQTSVTDLAGAYSAVFTAVNGSMTMKSRKHVVYTITAL